MTDSEILCELVINLGVFPKNEMSEFIQKSTWNLPETNFFKPDNLKSKDFRSGKIRWIGNTPDFASKRHKSLDVAFIARSKF